MTGVADARDAAVEPGLPRLHLPAVMRRDTLLGSFPLYSQQQRHAKHNGVGHSMSRE